MTEQQWQELIPFYVAQTLPPEQARAFEQYAAAQGERAAREIEEWRRLAAAVWAEADDAARNLPPLSQEVYNRLSYRDAPPMRYSTNPPRPDYAAADGAAASPRRSSGGVPITLVAGIVMALIFGSLLLGLSLRSGEENADSTQIAQNATTVITESAEVGAITIVEESATPSGTPIIAPTGTPIPGSGILNTPVLPPTPTNTLVTRPSATPLPPTSALPATEVPQLPPNSGGEAPESAALVQEDEAPPGGGPYITMTPGLMEGGYHQCFLFNPTDTPIAVHRYAGGSEIIGRVAPDDVFRTLIRSDSGWYQIFLPGGGPGWVAPGNAYLTGNCDASLFWVPTATWTPTPRITRTPSPTERAILAIGPGNVSIVEVPTTTLHEQPLATSPIVATVELGDRLIPLAATSTDGTMWTQVRFGEEVGWIITAQITTYAEEDAPQAQAEETAEPGN